MPRWTSRVQVPSPAPKSANESGWLGDSGPPAASLFGAASPLSGRPERNPAREMTLASPCPHLLAVHGAVVVVHRHRRVPTDGAHDEVMNLRRPPEVLERAPHRPRSCPRRIPPATSAAQVGRRAPRCLALGRCPQRAHLSRLPRRTAPRRARRQAEEARRDGGSRSLTSRWQDAGGLRLQVPAVDRRQAGARVGDRSLRRQRRERPALRPARRRKDAPRDRAGPRRHRDRPHGPLRDRDCPDRVAGQGARRGSARRPARLLRQAQAPLQLDPHRSRHCTRKRNKRASEKPAQPGGTTRAPGRGPM